MSGQPYRYASDKERFRAEYMANLNLRAELDEKTLQAVKTYVSNGSLPAVSQIADTRTTAQKLLDLNGLKQNIVKDFTSIMDADIAESLIQGVIQSPLNVDNRLLLFVAQRAPEIAQQLAKLYKYKIKGDSNDIMTFVEFLNNMYATKNNSTASMKSFIDRGYDKSSGIANAGDLMMFSEELTSMFATLKAKAYAGHAELNPEDPLNQYLHIDAYGGLPRTQRPLRAPKQDIGQNNFVILDDINDKLHNLIRFLPTDTQVNQLKNIILNNGLIGNQINAVPNLDVYEEFLEWMVQALPNKEFLKSLAGSVKSIINTSRRTGIALDTDLIRRNLERIWELIPEVPYNFEGVDWSLLNPPNEDTRGQYTQTNEDTRGQNNPPNEEEEEYIEPVGLRRRPPNVPAVPQGQPINLIDEEEEYVEPIGLRRRPSNVLTVPQEEYVEPVGLRRRPPNVPAVPQGQLVNLIDEEEEPRNPLLRQNNPYTNLMLTGDIDLSMIPERSWANNAMLSGDYNLQMAPEREPQVLPHMQPSMKSILNVQPPETTKYTPRPKFETKFRITPPKGVIMPQQTPERGWATDAMLSGDYNLKMAPERSWANDAMLSGDYNLQMAPPDIKLAQDLEDIRQRQSDVRQWLENHPDTKLDGITWNHVQGLVDINRERNREINRHPSISNEDKALMESANLKIQGLVNKWLSHPFDISGNGLRRRRGRPAGKGISIPVEQNIDRSKGIEQSLKFSPFGKYLIHNGKLRDNVISLKNIKGGNVIGLPSNKVSSHFGKVMKTIIGGGLPSFNDMNGLSEEEKKYLYLISSKANIVDKLNIPTPSKDQEEKDLHLFEVYKGEIMAGNDSKELIQKFKALLLKLSKNGSLPKQQVNEILNEILQLGY